MSLSIGIVGLPNVGKSTLFNALLKKQQALAANYPFATIEPNVGIVPVPDERLRKLAEVVAMERMHLGEGIAGKESLTYTKLPPLVPATVQFTDIAGIVKGASEGEGLGNQFLAHIRETDAIAFVVRAFVDPDVVQTGSNDVGDDLTTVKTELMIADMQTLDKQREPKGAATKEEVARWQAVQKVRAGLNAGVMVNEIPLTFEEWELIRPLFLLTAKPAIYVLNVGEAELSALSVGDLQMEYAQRLGVAPERVVVISAKVEAELSELSEEDQKEYLSGLGLEKSGLERLIEVGYATLGLFSFLTAGEKEVRAWTIRAGATAVEAAGVIHTDFMKKFIKADVVAFDDFVALGGWKGAREKGRARSEGRDYVMRDGDVVEFKIGG